MRKTDIVVASMLGVAWLVIALYVIPNYVGTALAGTLSPTFMPYTVVIIGLGLLTGVLVQRVLDKNSAPGPAPFDKRSAGFIAGMIATMFVAYFVIDRLGYLYGAPILIAGFMLLSRAKLWTIPIVAIATPFILWAVSWYGLTIPLP